MSSLIRVCAAALRDLRNCCPFETRLSHSILSRANRSCCSSSVSRAARYSLFASATSRLSRMARISSLATGSPIFFRSSATVAESLTDTRAIRSACGTTVPGTVIRRASVPPATVVNSMPAAVICSCVNRRIPGSSSAGFARGNRAAGSLAAVSRGCPAPGRGAKPTTLRNDCDNPGTKLARATPAASAIKERAKRPVIPGPAATRPYDRGRDARYGRHDGAEWGCP
jgi:hypothetical protein